MEGMSSPAKRIRTIAVTSGKGGVGKTNVVANLAVSLQRRGNNVLVFDADLGLSNIDVLFGIVPKYTIQHLLSGERSLQEVLVKGPEGILILPASSGVEEITHLDEFQRLRVLDEFDSFDGRIDYLLIDTGAGISSNVTFFCIAAQEIIVVITPEPTSLTDAYALIKVLYTKYQERNFKILVNYTKSSLEALETFRRLHLVTERFLKLSLDYLGLIPHDGAVKRAVIAQNAVVIREPDSSSSRSFRDLALKLHNSSNDERLKGSIQFFLGNLFGDTEAVNTVSRGAD